MALWILSHLFYFIWLHHVACGILVPWPGIKLMAPSVEAWSLNHWTTGRSPKSLFHRFQPIQNFGACDHLLDDPQRNLKILDRWAAKGLDFPCGSVIKNSPRLQETMQERWVGSLGQEDPLEEDLESHSSILAWLATFHMVERIQNAWINWTSGLTPHF